MKKQIAALLSAVLLLGSIPAAFAKEDKVLTVAVNAGFAPFEYYDDGILSGFDIDLMQYLGETSGYNVNFLETEFENLFPSVLSGEADCAISAISVTEQRKEMVHLLPYLLATVSYEDDFSNSVESEQYAIAFSKENKEIAGILKTALSRAEEYGVIADLIEMYEINTLSDTDSYDYEFTTVPKQNITVKSTDGNLEIGINKEPVFFSAPPFVDDSNRTQVPMREICEALGLSVLWDGETQTVTVSDVLTDLQFQIGSASYTKNGETFVMDTSAMIFESRTYLPLRYLAEMLGYEIAFIQETEPEPAPEEPAPITVDQFYLDTAYKQIQTLTELARREEYLKLTGTTKEVSEIISRIASADYTKASQIYRFAVNEKEAEAHIRHQYALSDAFSFDLLKKTGRYSLSTFATMINAQAGVETLAATAVMTSGKGLLMPADFTGNFALYLEFDGDYSALVSFNKTGEGVIGATLNFVVNDDAINFTDFFTELLGADGYRFEKIG